MRTVTSKHASWNEQIVHTGLSHIEMKKNVDITWENLDVLFVTLFDSQ